MCQRSVPHDERGPYRFSPPTDSPVLGAESVQSAGSFTRERQTRSFIASHIERRSEGPPPRLAIWWVMRADEGGTLVRRIRLRSEHLPVPIYVFSSLDGESADEEPIPIEPSWLGIVRWRDGLRETFELAFYRDDGRLLESLQYDTLEIALDQAADIVGPEPDGWEAVSIAMPHDRVGPEWPEATT